MVFKTSITHWIANLFATCFVLLTLSGFSQDSNAVSINPLPVVYSTPETGFAFGASVLASAYLNLDSAINRQSSTQMAFVFTTKKQILLYVPFKAYLNKKKQYHEGELGFFKYNYAFYGLGNESKSEDREIYQVTYPRVEYTFFKQRNDFLFFGTGIRTDKFEQLEFEEGGILNNRTVNGTQGGLFYALSLNFRADKRDDVFFPKEGFVLESMIEGAGLFGGSDYEGMGMMADFSYYKSIFKESVVAVNFGFESYDNRYPFYKKAKLGGTRRIRGLISGRYRDNGSLYFQNEWRIALAKRFYAAGFIGLGAVYQNKGEVLQNRWHNAVGGGLRYRMFKQNKLNVRFDVAYSEKDVQFYVTFGEAF
jgi:outer membrane protein assembly factor BamA